MPAELELTLQQLAQMALGAPHLTNVNLTILHSLLDLILKKLNCQNEKVSIAGLDSQCLEKMLKKSKISVLPLNDENIEVISEKLEKVSELEERVSIVDEKLEKHFAELRECRQMSAETFNLDDWEQLLTPYEDLCTVCDPENDIACNLIKNTDFIKKLMRRMAAPMVERIFEFEHKVERLHDRFIEFLERAEREYEKIALVERCIYEIESLRKKVDEYHLQFLGTMEEVQDMLDAKLDKVHIPALKKYIRERFEHIERDLKVLQSQKSCPKAAGVIMEGLKCVSCGGDKVCIDVGAHTTGMLPDMMAKKQPKLPKFCGCDGPCHTHSPPTEFRFPIVKTETGVHSAVKGRLGAKTCLNESRFDLLVGFDGNLYRKD